MGGTRKTINSDGAPAPIGPYSHATLSNGLLFCSGQIGVDPETEELVGGSVGDEATQCLRNLEAVCSAAGTSLDRALRLTIYTTVIEEFSTINESYASFFAEDPPARAVVGVAGLPKGALVEIDAVVESAP